MPVFPALLFNVAGDKGSFVPCGPECAQMDLGTCSFVRPQGLLLAPGVIADHSVRGVQHILRRAVILFELYDQRVRIDFFKIQNVADIGSPEAVDRLVVVSDYAEISVFSGEETDQLKLRVVGILILVDHDIAETVLIRTKHLVVGVEQLHGQHEQVVKVHRVVLAQSPLILVISVRDPLIAEADPNVFLPVLQRSDQLIFGRRDF